MNCIFITVFNQEQYVDMFLLLLESISNYGNLDNNTNILIYTSTIFMNIIKDNEYYNVNIKFEINDTYNDIDKACKARLDIFNLSSIVHYNKILYLDTDILIKGNLNSIFDICKDDILYVLEEGYIDSHTDFWGNSLFGDKVNEYIDKTAFTSGILLFNNCDKIKELFNKINEDIINIPKFFICYDQPYIVYNAFKYNLYDNKILKSFVVNNDNNIHSDKIIHHFPGGPGVYENKIKQMNGFLNDINQHNFKIYDTQILPIKNIKLPIVAICVSYNYFDTLQFMLPINYLHFDKFYLITQEDDILTINFCKDFDNVTVLFYDFKNNNNKFDKFGAINYVQQIAYENYPDSWYLIIDSDIILPNNFINILINENLNSNCIYGAHRYNVLKSSELLNKKDILNKEYFYNNIIWNKDKPPSILGCFQLYKKHCFNKNKYNNAGWGDYDFGYENFELFCNLENLIYLHLGIGGVNWDGKIVSFIDDIEISLTNIYFNFHKLSNNIYYNNKSQFINYGNSINKDTDIMTCSDKMRKDISDFFKHNSSFKIAEIGSYKGYTTKILSNIFSTVYAVENNIEWIDFNKNFNKKSKNIEYLFLNIYNWNTLPNDIQVLFINTIHPSKSNILNSIKKFTNLKYIIFDNYSIQSNIKLIIDQLIYNKILIFNQFIGIYNVLSTNGIKYDLNEGIICSIYKSEINTTIINKINPNNIIHKNNLNNKINPTNIIHKNNLNTKVNHNINTKVNYNINTKVNHNDNIICKSKIINKINPSKIINKININTFIIKQFY